MAFFYFSKNKVVLQSIKDYNNISFQKHRHFFMSMNRSIIIDGKHIETPHINTAKTSHILDFNVEDEQVNGISTGRFISSIDNANDFHRSLNRFKTFVLEKVVEHNDIDYVGIEAYQKIKDAMNFIEINPNDPNDYEVKEVLFSFL